MDWLQRRKYAVLLVALLALFVGYPLTKTFIAAILLDNLVFTAVFFVGLLAVARTPRRRWLIPLLGLPSLVFNWIAVMERFSRRLNSPEQIDRERQRVQDELFEGLTAAPSDLDGNVRPANSDEPVS